MDDCGDWIRAEAAFDSGVGERGSIGIIGLAPDRVGVLDFEEFLSELPGVAVFSTRIPMAPIGTPETLRALESHLTSASELLVPGSKLDVVALSCTSGTVAIGPQKVRAAIRASRANIHVATPIEAGAKALRKFNARRISLLAPYRIETADLISTFFEAEGFEIAQRATFSLDGDKQTNCASGEAITAAAVRYMHPESEALFISCTALRTAPIIDRIEGLINRPVVTSNQALAWDCLRLCGVNDRVRGRGTLFQIP